MLLQTSKINGYSIAASDGELGTISDFLFDDVTWSVRWLVVDTGHWLSGRKILLPPSALGSVDAQARDLSVKLTKQQVKDSPQIDTDRPVSRQMEMGVFNYYGWSPYWGSGLGIGTFGFNASAMGSPYLLSAQRERILVNERSASHDDVHLRSVEAVSGYHIHASDGEIGHVRDFLVDDSDWSIHYLVVDTTNWWPGKKILVSSRSAGYINWTDKMVNLDIDRQMIKNSPTYDTSMVIDRAYDKKLLAYYGISSAAA